MLTVRDDDDDGDDDEEPHEVERDALNRYIITLALSRISGILPHLCLLYLEHLHENLVHLELKP